MRSPTEIIVFLLIMTSVLGLAHYYLWRRLIRDADLPRLARRTLSVLLVLLLLLQPATFALIRSAPRPQLAPWAFVAFSWMGLLSTLFVLLVLADLCLFAKRLGTRFLSRETKDGDRINPARRAMLGRMVAGGVAFGGVAITATGVAHARGLRLAQVEIKLDRLPLEFDGFKIVQMTDIHVGPTIGKEFVEMLVEKCNAQNPDLVAITGDLVDGSVKHLSKHTEPFSKLEARYGTVFVTGNHEYYSGADEWIDELKRIGIPTLRNDSMRIERAGVSFLVVGVTDYRAGHYGDAPDLPLALEKRRAGEEVVLLAHQPRAFAEAADHDVGLQLSGHTHGGQFWPWNWVIHLIEPVVAGWARKNRTQIYVSSGTGYWGPPMRLGTEAEVTVVTLRAGKA